MTRRDVHAAPLELRAIKDSGTTYISLLTELLRRIKDLTTTYISLLTELKHHRRVMCGEGRSDPRISSIRSDTYVANMISSNLSSVRSDM
jgi:hypothetical protein